MFGGNRYLIHLAIQRYEGYMWESYTVNCNPACNRVKYKSKWLPNKMV